MSEVLTGAETKKALKCCINGKCSECPLRAMNCSAKVAMAFANDLINRYEAEIERLEKGSLKEAMTFNSKTIATAVAEAIKEFAEELKEKAHRCDLSTDEHEYYSVGVVEIDILLEKKAGENNG